MAARKWDWPCILSEYISGVDLPELADKYAVPLRTLQVTASRKKWKLQRVKNGETRTAIVVESVNRSIANDAKRFTEVVSAGITTAIQTAFSRPLPVDPHAFNAHAGGLQKLNDIGRKTFGLDDTTKLEVRIGLVGELPKLVQPTLEQQSPAIIDVSATSELVNNEPSTNSTEEQSVQVPDVQGDGSTGD